MIAWETKENFARKIRPLTRFVAARTHWHFSKGGSPWLEFSYTMGIYERPVLRKCLGVLEKGDLALDVGANYGYFTRHFARAVGPTGRVIAVEPHPITAEFLRANTVDFPQTTVIEAAATDTNGKADLWETAASDANTLFPLDRPRSGIGSRRIGQITVQTIRLDDTLLEATPKLIKLDIEGSEPAALRGLHQTLNRVKKTYLIVEFAPAHLRGANEDPHEFLSKLREQFHVEALGREIPEKIADDSTWAVNLWCYR